MPPLFNESASKKATNLSINSDLLSKARQRKINLSATLEKALITELRKTERERWREENKDAIDAVNEQVENYGLFSDSFRKF